jgi:serine/threonine protein kinase
MVSKLPYLLKMVNTKDSSDKIKYQRLVNEIGILKILSNPAIVECHKMLKTSNNIYLVYDYCDGSTLSEFMTNSSKEQSNN